MPQNKYIESRISAVSVKAILVLTTVIIFVWNYFNPRGMDDYYFCTTMPGGNDATAYMWMMGEPLSSLGEALKTCGHVFLYGLGRWPNFVVIIFSLLPTAILRTVLSCAMVLDIYLIIRMALGRRHLGIAACIATIVAWWVILPWYNCFYSLAFQSNYILTTAVMLTLLLWLPKAQNYVGWRRVLFLLFCVFAAQGHEGFAIVTGSFIFGLWTNAGMARWRFYLPVLMALFVGFCINLVGGTMSRLNAWVYVSNGPLSTLPFLLTRIASQTWPFLLTIVTFLVRWFTATDRKAQWQRFVPYLFAILANLAIALLLAHLDRIFWPAFVLCIVYLVDSISRIPYRIPTIVKAGCAIAFIAAYAWWGLQLIGWERHIRSEYDILYNTVVAQSSTPTTIYRAPYTPTTSRPYYLMSIAQNPIDDKFGRQGLAAIGKPRIDSQLLVASPSMAGSFDTWPSIEGTAGVRGVWPMVATRDTTHSKLMFTIEPPRSNQTPINRLILRLSAGADLEPRQLELLTDYLYVINIDGDTLYTIEHEPMPRTLVGGTVLSIDTIP